jgi:hypothetical protein
MPWRFAYAAVQLAVERKGKVSEKERMLIEALARRYAADPEAERAPLDAAYAEAMAAVYEQYPEDNDVATLYAVLKQKHGLSMQAWIFRAADLGIVEQAHARSLFAKMSAGGWRRQEPVEFNGEERPRKLQQLTVRALAEGLLSIAQAERICPGVSRATDELDVAPLGSLSARSLVRLPPAERERLLAQAAEAVADEYEEGGTLSGFEALSWEDHFDTPVSD